MAALGRDLLDAIERDAGALLVHRQCVEGRAAAGPA
jgi:hypothetical protein